MRKNLKVLSDTVTSHPKFRCVEDLVFLCTIYSWKLGLSDHYNTQQVIVANLNWKGLHFHYTPCIEVAVKKQRIYSCVHVSHSSNFIYVAEKVFSPIFANRN